jgi:hypothetical protein
MRTRVVATVSSSKAINKHSNKVSRVNVVNRGRKAAVNRASKDLKATRKEANRQADRKTVDSQTLTGNAAVSIVAARWAATGAIIVNFPRRFANVCVKHRICDGLGAGRLDEVIEELKRLADGRMEGDAATASHLKAEVVEPLRQLELDLSRALQQQSGRTNLRLRDEGAAPEKYRKAVEEYYRRLSGARQRQ